MPPIGVRAVPHIKRGVEDAQQWRVSDGFDSPLEQRTRRVELAVAMRQDRDTKPLGRQYCLQISLKVPALNDDGVEIALREPRTDFRGIAAGKAVEARPLGNVVQEDMIEAREQIDIPFEVNAETRIRLIRRRRAMCK